MTASLMNVEQILLLCIGALLTALSTSNRIRLGRIEEEVKELVNEKNGNRARIITLEAQQRNTEDNIAEMKQTLHEINRKLDDIARTCAAFIGSGRPHP